MHGGNGDLGWLRLVLFGGITALALESPGCGGIMVDSTGNRGDGGPSSWGPSSGGVVGFDGVPVPDPGSAGRPSAPRCGNGKLDKGEVCDGTVLGGATCATATMAANVSGTLRCAPSCQAWDLTGCRKPGMGTGGVVGAGGYLGAGGYVGTGGFSSADSCYESGGVPTGPTTCAYGYVASEQCLGSVGAGGTTAGCEQGCGCKLCPGAYTRCILDGGCSSIFSCARQNACTGIKDCYAFGCASTIDRAGGLGSSAARYADAALSCLSQNGCPLSCTTPPPPPPPVP